MANIDTKESGEDFLSVKRYKHIADVTSASVPLPQWHEDLLDERARLIETGEAQFDDWETAKKRITEQTS